jgi:hypothetical protein
MASWRVTCKEKHSIYERIVAISCINDATGSTQRFLEDDAITRIEKHLDTFYDEDEKGHRVPVEVREREGRKFLITKRDGIREDNLLYLPDCATKKPTAPGTIRTVAAAGSHSVPFAPYWRT